MIAASKEGHVDVVAILLEHAAKYNIPDTVSYSDVKRIFEKEKAREKCSKQRIFVQPLKGETHANVRDRECSRQGK